MQSEREPKVLSVETIFKNSLLFKFKFVSPSFLFASTSSLGLAHHRRHLLHLRLRPRHQRVTNFERLVTRIREPKIMIRMSLQNTVVYIIRSCSSKERGGQTIDRLARIGIRLGESFTHAMRTPAALYVRPKRRLHRLKRPLL